MTTKREKHIGTILRLSTKRVQLEQLAEEAVELSKAALKLIRAAGLSENPTPTSFDEAEANLLEEFEDVLIAMDVLGIKIPDYQNSPKYERWADRLIRETQRRNSQSLKMMMEGIDEKKSD